MAGTRPNRSLKTEEIVATGTAYTTILYVSVEPSDLPYLGSRVMGSVQVAHLARATAFYSVGSWFKSSLDKKLLDFAGQSLRLMDRVHANNF